MCQWGSLAILIRFKKIKTFAANLLVTNAVLLLLYLSHKMIEHTEFKLKHFAAEI